VTDDREVWKSLHNYAADHSVAEGAQRKKISPGLVLDFDFQK
jgi:hypothetical protein